MRALGRSLKVRKSPVLRAHWLRTFGFWSGNGGGTPKMRKSAARARTLLGNLAIFSD